MRARPARAVSVNGALHILVGSLGLAFALMILRADPRKWDNRAFSMLGVLDASMALYRGIAAASGVDIADRAVMLPCAMLSPLLAWWSIEFAYSFPFGRRLPWRWRGALLAWMAVTVAALAVLGARSPWVGVVANTGFFIPSTLIMVTLAVRNLRRVPGDRFGVRLVILAITIRWITANVVYALPGTLDADTWSTLLWIESTVVVVIAYVLISFANIRSNLFTMRSAVGELVLEAGFVLSGLILTAAAIDAALRLAVYWPHVERTLLMVAALVPLAVYGIAGRLRPRLEASVDPRRALRRDVLERALRPADEADVDALAATAAAALAEISGGDARFERDVPPVTDAEGGTLAVPVRRGDDAFGALVVRGGVLDRETAHAADQLAERLALAHAYRRVVGELEESRRLAALGAFAAAIAHDIRTPLTSIQMNVQILRGKARLPPDDMEYFEIALAELRRLDEHVRELLDYAKPLQLHRETVAIRELADAAARTVEPVLAERGVRLACAHDDGVPAVSVDPHRLEQVLWNLLENAARASPPGGAITVRTRADGDRVAIDVVDHGAGIAPADLARIFEPFFTTRPDGTGLGLAICQKVVRAHAGEIRVASTVAEGSTFTVLLPA